MQSNQKYYVPCLRWKMGEYQAMMRLSAATRNLLMPIIEVPERGWDFEKNREAKTLDQHLEKFDRHVLEKWGRQPCFIDGRLLQTPAQMADGKHAITMIFEGLQDDNCRAIPVTGLERPSPYQTAIKNVISQKQSPEVAIRITLRQALASDASAKICHLLSNLGKSCEEAHIMVDLEAPANFEPIHGLARVVEEAIKSIPNLAKWRTCVLLGTSFLKTMGEVKKGPTVLPRSEWLLYKELLSRSKGKGYRVPTFGDYAIQHPDVWQVDMRKAKPAASLRYSSEDIWYISKGSNVRDNGYEQYQEMCKKLVSSPYFSGRGSSFGDNYIADCASGKGATGNLTMWRCVGTNHHLARVAFDVANLFGL